MNGSHSSAELQKTPDAVAGAAVVRMTQMTNGEKGEGNQQLNRSLQ